MTKPKPYTPPVDSLSDMADDLLIAMEGICKFECDKCEKQEACLAFWDTKVCKDSPRKLPVLFRMWEEMRV
jgi:hypothetical protein